MIRRSRAREIALQILYEDDLNPSEGEDRTSPDRTAQFIEQRLSSEELRVFCRSLVDGVRRNRGEIDAMLAQTAVNWSLARMAATDRNLLRMGAYEILYTDTPNRVAINEAVELAKRYGARHSPQFVNGILDKLQEDRRE